MHGHIMGCYWGGAYEGLGKSVDALKPTSDVVFKRCLSYATITTIEGLGGSYPAATVSNSGSIKRTATGHTAM